MGCSHRWGWARAKTTQNRALQHTTGQCCSGWWRGTLVIPRTPILGLDEVDPLPVPSSPAIMQQMPSVKIPL